MLFVGNTNEKSAQKMLKLQYSNNTKIENEVYFGYKVYVMITFSAFITRFEITPA